MDDATETTVKLVKRALLTSLFRATDHKYGIRRQLQNFGIHCMFS